VDAQTGGDEPVELAKKLLGKAIVVADADRVAAAHWAKANYGITAFVLDDAFQHRRAKRNLDVVCIDATDPFGNGKILPSGKLREALAGVSRAEAIVITRSDQSENIDKIEDCLRKANNVVPVFKSSTSMARFVALDEFHAKTQSTQSDQAMDGFAFAGIANPKVFFVSLKNAGVELKGSRSFADHHRYTQKDLTAVEEQARTIDAQVLITTAKDAVKLEGFEFSMPCYVAEIETVIDEPGRFRDLVLSA
jgi:tetraacyldisaccharide 4'-kinase